MPLLVMFYLISKDDKHCCISAHESSVSLHTFWALQEYLRRIAYSVYGWPCIDSFPSDDYRYEEEHNLHRTIYNHYEGAGHAFECTTAICTYGFANETVNHSCYELFRITLNTQSNQNPNFFRT